MRLRVNSPDVIHETIDGEVVIIHLTSGAYYNLADTAGEIWGLLDAGVPDNEVAAALLGRYDAALDDIAPVVDRFVGELRADELLVPDESGPGASGPSEDRSWSAPRQPFRSPQLEKFTDMEHLIALDPIHEVDAQRGWPHRP